MKTLRCAIYTRKSSEEGLEQGFNSLDAQREACAAYVLSQAGEGWKALAAEYDDGGFSGGNMQRPAMQRLLADIDKGLIDIVVVYKVDRLTRSLSDFSKIVDRFDARSVSFVSVTQACNTTSSMGRLTLNVLLSFAQFEREVTGERIRDKVAASKAKGMWMGGRPPLGYDVVDHRLRINESEAETVQAIFARYLDLGSVLKLTRELAETSVRSKAWIGKDGAPRGGGFLGRGAIYHLLANPVYRGAIRHGVRLHLDSHSAIVEEALWDAVQALLATNDLTKPASEKAGAGAMLKGLLWDDAGNVMQPSHTRRHQRRYHYYVTAALVHGDSGQPGTLPRISAHVLDALVINSVKPRLKPDRGSSDSLEMRVRGALRKVVLGAAVVSLELALEACRIDVANQAAPDSPCVVITIPISLKHRQRATLIQPEARLPTQAPTPDRILIRAICIAREWRRRLELGDVASTRELAIAEGLCNRHTGRLLPLAYLAPDLVEVIMEGRQPRAMTLQGLTEKPLPRTWDEQRALVASFA